jgi:hypothetical protein
MISARLAVEKATAHALIFQAPGFQGWFPKL